MTEHYYSEKQSSKYLVSKFKDTLRGVEYEFFTAPGIFSFRKVDFGTRVLVENMKIGSNDSVLDLGCGIGIIGAVAARLTSSRVVLTDVNKRAVKVAKMNVKGLSNASVVQGDKFENVKGKFNVILFNPPQTAGKDVCFSMIEESKDYLVSGGSLQLVARHNKGGKTLSLKMEEVFGNVDIIVKKGGYRVYVSEQKV